jgi:prepilin-type N-terminal cleavage/methylation domain-containing protein
MTAFKNIFMRFLKPNMQRGGTTREEGFTLVEMMVSVSVFVIVMVISTGSILSVFDANNKSQNLRAVMDNFNFTMEGMTRTIRFGKNYHCDATQPNHLLPRDCAGGATSIEVLSPTGSQVVYKLSGTKIVRSTNGVDYDLTASDVTITNLSFRVFGSPLYGGGTDLYQPQVIIVVSGYAGSKATTKSTFNLETTVSQRQFDSQ